MKVLLFIVLGVLLSWCMWIKGIGIMQKKIAVAFIGRRGKTHRGAAMTAATGWTKQVLPLKEGQKYRFYYDVNLTDGDIIVEIIHNKQVIKTFDAQSRTTVLPAEKGRYIMGTKFAKASGDYELKWEEI